MDVVLVNNEPPWLKERCNLVAFMVIANFVGVKNPITL